jgi:hypothetical protein
MSDGDERARDYLVSRFTALGYTPMLDPFQGHDEGRRRDHVDTRRARPSGRDALEVVVQGGQNSTRLKSDAVPFTTRTEFVGATWSSCSGVDGSSVAVQVMSTCLLWPASTTTLSTAPLRSVPITRAMTPSTHRAIGDSEWVGVGPDSNWARVGRGARLGRGSSGGVVCAVDDGLDVQHPASASSTIGLTITRTYVRMGRVL